MMAGGLWGVRRGEGIVGGGRSKPRLRHLPRSRRGRRDSECIGGGDARPGG